MWVMGRGCLMPGRSYLNNVSDRMLLFRLQVRVTIGDSIERDHGKL